MSDQQNQEKQQDQPIYLASTTTNLLVHKIDNPGAVYQFNSVYNGSKIYQISFSPNNQLLAICGEFDSRILIIKLDNNQVLQTIDVSCRDLCFSSNSQYVAFGCDNGTVGFYNLQTRKIEKLYAEHEIGESICSISLNCNDQLLASASFIGNIIIRPIFNHNENTVTFKEKEKITFMRFSSVKSYILACSFDSGKIAVYDLNQQIKKHSFVAHQGTCTSLCFSPLNHLLLSSCGLDGKIQFYDIQVGKTVKTIETQNQLTAMGFSPDGHTISVGTKTGKIKIYDLKDAKKVKLELMGQEGSQINCLQFSRLIKNKGSSSKSGTPSSQKSAQQLNQAQTNTFQQQVKALNEVSNNVQQEQIKEVNKVNNQQMSEARSKYLQGKGNDIGNKLPPKQNQVQQKKTTENKRQSQELKDEMETIKLIELEKQKET